MKVPDLAVTTVASRLGSVNFAILPPGQPHDPPYYVPFPSTP